MALEVGSRLGHYDVTALIGEGGMGQVYRATDTKLDRQVALKILPEFGSRNSRASCPQTSRPFEAVAGETDWVAIRAVLLRIIAA